MADGANVKKKPSSRLGSVGMDIHLAKFQGANLFLLGEGARPVGMPDKTKGGFLIKEAGLGL
ncbi:MAG: hypothetical protein EBT68_03295 [Verrucomicrobia bacterium]|nr:hypothetical protein [Verrucomicrobiota bacterium]